MGPVVLVQLMDLLGLPDRTLMLHSVPAGGKEAKGLEAEWKRRRDGGRAAPGVLHAGALRPLVSLAAGTVIRRRGSPARGSAAERNWHRLPSWPEQADPALPPAAPGAQGFVGRLGRSGDRGRAGEGRRRCRASVLTVQPRSPEPKGPSHGSR